MSVKGGIRVFRNAASTLLVLMAVALTISVQAYAQNHLCISHTDSVTGSPSIDGIVYQVGDPSRPTGPPQPYFGPDIGWTRAARFNLFPFNAQNPNGNGFGVPKIGDLQLVRDTNFVYVSYYIQDPPANVDDTVVLVFSTDGNPAHDWRIEINPFDAAIPADNKGYVPAQVHFWRDSTKWNIPAQARRDPGPAPWISDPGTLQINAANFQFSTFLGAWAIEIRIPWEKKVENAGANTGIFFPASGSFQFYADVLQTADGALEGNVAQSPWPVTSGIIPPQADLALEDNTPPSSAWGTATFDDPSVHTACTSLSVGENDIGVLNQITPNPPGDTNILRFKFGGSPEVLPPDCTVLDNSNPAGPANRLFANAHNSGPSAPHVKATFRFANWGIPPVDPNVRAWTLAGGTTPAGLVLPNNTNPTSEQTVPPGGTFFLDWQLTQRQSCVFAKGGNSPGNGHFCMAAALESRDGSVRLLNTSARRNMNFVTTSAFSDIAEISGVGYKNAPGHTAQDLMVTVESIVRHYRANNENTAYCQVTGQQATTTTRQPTSGEVVVPPGPGEVTTTSGARTQDEFSCIPARAFPKGLTEAMIWVARGYRKTGNVLVIRKKKYELLDGIGGFGYVAGHNGAVSDWKQGLSGRGMKKVAENLYKMQVPTDGVEIVSTHIESKECTNSFCCKIEGSGSAFVLLAGIFLLGLWVCRPVQNPRRDEQGR